jgi:hypothetical protein
MKVGGVENVKDVKYGPVVFSRGKGPDGEERLLAFYAQPVWTMDEFEKKCSPPECDYYYFEKDGKKKDYEHPEYLQKVAEHDRKRWGYYTLKSLEPSNLELEKASLGDPSTWGNVEAELKSELNQYEFVQLMNLVNSANSLDSRKLEANLETFLQRQARRTEGPGPSGDLVNTSSSEPASE